jgi:hypothetical protein
MRRFGRTQFFGHPYDITSRLKVCMSAIKITRPKTAPFLGWAL